MPKLPHYPQTGLAPRLAEAWATLAGVSEGHHPGGGHPTPPHRPFSAHVAPIQRPFSAHLAPIRRPAIARLAPRRLPKNAISPPPLAR